MATQFLEQEMKIGGGDPATELRRSCPGKTREHEDDLLKKQMWFSLKAVSDAELLHYCI